jgi:CubicO group peptidase (beta-lactamase class C family)
MPARIVGFAIGLSFVLAANLSRADDSKNGTKPAINIAGVWDTSFGFATIHTTPIEGKKTLSVTGFYNFEKDKKGIIRKGTFDPATGILELTYFESWQNDSIGTAHFTLAADHNHFKGKFKQGGLSGDWDMTRVRGHDFASGLDSIVADAGIRPTTPGVAVLVLDHGEVLFRKIYGLAHLRDKKPITASTTFELASVSKQFAGTAILRLYEENKLALDDDVRKYLPELPVYDAKRPIRILNLARQTSGLPEYMDLENVKSKDPKFLTNSDYVGEFAKQRKKFPPKFPPGSDWKYTNTNFMLLALIVERVSKKPFAAFMRSEIFEPLKMTTAGVYEHPNFKPHDPALGYHKEKNEFQESWGPPPFRHESLLTVGDGSVWASLDDMARWDDGWRLEKVLKPETIKLALVPSKYGKDQTTDYAFGWGVTLGNGKLVKMAHNGSWGGFHTFIHRNVAEQQTLIVLSNVDSMDVDAVDRLFGAMPPKKN